MSFTFYSIAVNFITVNGFGEFAENTNQKSDVILHSLWHFMETIVAVVVVVIFVAIVDMLYPRHCHATHLYSKYPSPSNIQMNKKHRKIS